MAAVNDKGVAVRLPGGGYYFSPASVPTADSQAGAIPLRSGGAYIVGMAGNSAVTTSDAPLVIPAESGTPWAAKNVIPLPLKLTDARATQTVAKGYEISLGTFTFYWNGSGNLYISGSSTGAAALSIDDGIGVSCERGTSGTDPGSDTTLTDPINITNWSSGGVNLFQAGNNTVTFKIGNNWGSTVGCSALYIVQTS